LTPDATQLERLVETERWVAWVRLGGLVFALFEVGLFSYGYPPGYEASAWTVTGLFAAGSVALFLLARRGNPRLAPVLSVAALVFDTAIVCAYAVVYSYEYGSPTRWALIVVIAEASLRYGLVGGLGLPLLLIPFFVFAEWWRSQKFGPPAFRSDRVTFPAGILLLTGTIMGRLVQRLDQEAALARSRATEAERLRDELGRRVDLLEGRTAARGRSARRSSSSTPSARSSASSAGSCRSTGRRSSSASTATRR
jgi:hypothetical protein